MYFSTSSQGFHAVHELPDLDRNGVTMALDAADEAMSFYGAQWLRAWANAFLPDRGWARPLTAWAVGSGDATVGFIALAHQTVSGLRMRSLAGYYWPFRTLAVRDDDDSRKAFAASVARHFSKRPPATVLRFGPVSSHDKAFDALLESLLDNGWSALRHEGGQAFLMDLPEDEASLEKNLGKHLLTHARYYRRRMEKRGSLSFERHVLGTDSAAALDAAEAIEAASWVAKKGGDLKFAGAANRKFWASLGASSGQPFRAVIWILRCGSTPVAFSAHVETAATVYIIANSYDEEWQAHRPGSVLSLELLGDACRRGKKRVDWGQGDSGYKSRWGATPSASLFDVILFRPGIRGRMVRALAQRFLPEWRPLDHA